MNTHQSIIIKIGSSTLLDQHNKVNSLFVKQLAVQLVKLQQLGYAPVLVCSGAVSHGKSFYSSTSSQLASGVGQLKLLTSLSSIFAQHHLELVQILLTQEQLQKQKIRKHIRTVINEAGENNYIPLINENDLVNLNNFGGNDTLASIIAQLLKSRYLILLTDVAGVYDSKGRVLEQLSDLDQLVIRKSQQKAQVSIGGMHAKVMSALQASKQGIKTYITNWHDVQLLEKVVSGQKFIGTQVLTMNSSK